jgi:putative endonuclease
MKIKYFYKGHCEDILLRIAQHNSGSTKSIQPYLPFQLVYFEKFETRMEAIIREKYFKTASGMRFVKKQIDQGFDIEMELLRLNSDQ